jgi:valyl-tRNA synthetase
MKPLAEKALASWRRGEIVFYPKKWENTYQHWMENIRDWCVSRQLWWGHRIPAWYCGDCGETSVSRTDLAACPHCGSKAIEQDSDVLDTWFSSWLWPFSTLGWPGTSPDGEVSRGSSKGEPRNGDNETSDFKNYYPTTALVTAYDIIFFWVSRMIMAGLEFTGKAPFRDIYIHGLVRDKQGRKMSKSLGNGLDPLELVDEFGADALKFTLAFMCAQGQDILVDRESFKMGSKFANKVWNASRYILMNLEGRNWVKDPGLIPADKWIYSRLNSAARAMEAAFLSYRYNDAAQTAYEYFWNDFCDWYVEATKLSLRDGDGAEQDRALTVLLDVLAASLRLLHPLLPFVTEEIYGKLPPECRSSGIEGGGAGEGLLITAPYPQYDQARSDPQGEQNFAFLQELVRQIRTIRSECTIPPEKKVPVLVSLRDDLAPILRENEGLVKLLAGIGDLDISPGAARTARPSGAIGLVAQSGFMGQSFEIFVFIADAVDMGVLKQKFRRELEKDRKFTGGLEAKLGNEQFLKNAPPELVAGEKIKLAEAQKRIEKLEAYIRDMA